MDYKKIINLAVILTAEDASEWADLSWSEANRIQHTVPVAYAGNKLIDNRAYACFVVDDGISKMRFAVPLAK